MATTHKKMEWHKPVNYMLVMHEFAHVYPVEETDEVNSV